MKVEQFNKFLLKQYKIYFMILDQQTHVFCGQRQKEETIINLKHTHQKQKRIKQNFIQAK